MSAFRNGRGPWIAVVLAAFAVVGSDFVRHPYVGASDADVPAGERGLTIWTAGTDASSSPGLLARELGAALGASVNAVRVGVHPGGSSAEILDRLSPGASDDALLVVHAGTLAELERERRDVEIPGAAQQAARAVRLLRAAQPIALLADDGIAIAVPTRSRLRSLGAIERSLRDRPGELVFGVAPDAWSKAVLAALVGSAGARGQVPYRAAGSTGEAAVAAGDGNVAVVVGARSEVLTARRSHALRVVADGFADDLLRGAHRWIAVVAPPSMPAARRIMLTRRIEALVAGPAWAGILRRLHLREPPAHAPASVVADGERFARRLASHAYRIDRLSTSTKIP